LYTSPIKIISDRLNSHQARPPHPPKKKHKNFVLEKKKKKIKGKGASKLTQQPKRISVGIVDKICGQTYLAEQI
jgi:hypothetical protein